MKSRLLLKLTLLVLSISCGGSSGGSSARVINSSDGRVSLSIPAGALDSSQNITIQPRDDLIPGTLLRYELSPDGLTFNSPATLSVDVSDLVDKDSIKPISFFLISGGTVSAIENQSLKVEDNKSTWSGEISHFSSIVARQEDVLILIRDIPDASPINAPFENPVRLKISYPENSTVSADSLLYFDDSELPVDQIGERTLELGPLKDSARNIEENLSYQCFGARPERGFLGASVRFVEYTMHSGEFFEFITGNLELNDAGMRTNSYITTRQKEVHCTSVNVTADPTPSPSPEEEPTPEDTSEQTKPSIFTHTETLSFEHIFMQSDCPQVVGQIRVFNSGAPSEITFRSDSDALAVTPASVTAAGNETVIATVSFLCDASFSSGRIIIEARTINDDGSLSEEVATLAVSVGGTITIP